MIDAELDERRGRPSASGADRWFRCPGSERMIRSMPTEKRDTPTEDSLKGDRIHSALERGKMDGLSDEEKDVLIACQEMEREARDVWFSMLGHDKADGYATLREERIWSTCNGLSGKADVIYLVGDGAQVNHALILDFKTGRGDVEHARGNLQLRTLAWLLHDRYNDMTGRLETVTVGIIQPLATKKIELVRYTADDLRRAEKDIRDAIEDVDLPDAPLIAGSVQCKWCPAKASCHEAQEALVETSNGYDVLSLPNDRLAFLLDRWQMVKKVGAELEKEAKRRLEDCETLEDHFTGTAWKLQDGARVRTIVDPQAAFAAVQDVISVEEFTAIASIPIGKLTAQFAKSAGIPKAEASRVLDERLGDALAVTRKAPSLKRYNPHLIDG